MPNIEVPGTDDKEKTEETGTDDKRQGPGVEEDATAENSSNVEVTE